MGAGGGCMCCAVLCCAVLCCSVLCCAVLCCAVLCCAVLRRAAPMHRSFSCHVTFPVSSTFVLLLAFLPVSLPPCQPCQPTHMSRLLPCPLERAGGMPKNYMHTKRLLFTRALSLPSCLPLLRAQAACPRTTRTSSA